MIFLLRIKIFIWSYYEELAFLLSTPRQVAVRKHVWLLCVFVAHVSLSQLPASGPLLSPKITNPSLTMSQSSAALILVNPDAGQQSSATMQEWGNNCLNSLFMYPKDLWARSQIHFYVPVSTDTEYKEFSQRDFRVIDNLTLQKCKPFGWLSKWVLCRLLVISPTNTIIKL